VLSALSPSLASSETFSCQRRHYRHATLQYRLFERVPREGRQRNSARPAAVANQPEPVISMASVSTSPSVALDSSPARRPVAYATNCTVVRGNNFASQNFFVNLFLKVRTAPADGPLAGMS